MVVLRSTVMGVTAAAGVATKLPAIDHIKAEPSGV
jgi:hypothetical protein